MANWYDSLDHVGMIETGTNSIYEFEVYRHPSGELLFCNHDDPDTPLELIDIVEFDMSRNSTELEDQLLQMKLIP